MKIELDPQQGYVVNGHFDQYEALKSVGVKAAVCYKEVLNDKLISQSEIRKESDAILINRALNTIFLDHTTPSEHQMVSLEITSIPKILCMVLNNEKQYTADERSLRYTSVYNNQYISELEVKLYNKWILIFENLIKKKMFDFYLKYNKTEKKALQAIHKIAQENARYMVSVFMPTTITYTVPFIQLNKLLVYMQRIIKNPNDKLEEMLIPYFKEFINLCISKNVALTKNSIYNVVIKNEDVKNRLFKKYPEIKQYVGSNELLYKNNKDIDLSLFASRNKFSGINLENEYGVNVSYNNFESFACLAQEQRHRTIDCEMLVLDNFQCFVPPILIDFKDKNLINEYLNDMFLVSNYFPQGQLVKVNRLMSVKNLLKFVSQERACEMAQLEIENVYIKNIIPDLYDALTKRNDSLKEQVKPYVKRKRCQFPGYHCPNPCSHVRMDRKV